MAPPGVWRGRLLASATMGADKGTLAWRTKLPLSHFSPFSLSARRFTVIW